MNKFLIILGVLFFILVNYYYYQGLDPFMSTLKIIVFNITSILVLYSDDLKYLPENKYISLYFLILSIPIIIINIIFNIEYMNIIIYLIILINMILLIIAFTKSKKKLENSIWIYIKYTIIILLVLPILILINFYVGLIIFLIIVYFILTKMINKKETYLTIKYFSFVLTSLIISFFGNFNDFLIFIVLYFILELILMKKNDHKYNFKVTETLFSTGLIVIYFMSIFNADVQFIQNLFNNII